MALINRIDFRLKTGNRSGAGTDGDVYVGVGGREFSLDSAIDDFEANSDRIYIAGVGGGEGSTINFRTLNDPAQPYQLRTEQLDTFPVYVRFEPKDRDDNWNLEEITVTVNPGTGQIVYRALGGSNHLWLGTCARKVLLPHESVTMARNHALKSKR